MSRTNAEVLPDLEPVTMPVLQDINGNTALDIALAEETFSINLASFFLEGIQDYPFMHCGFALVSGINKAFQFGVPHLGEYLDRRIIQSEHLQSKGLTRAGIVKHKIQLYYVKDPNPDLEMVPCRYGSMVSDVWQDRQKIKDKMYDHEEFKTKLDICYFDIP